MTLRYWGTMADGKVIYLHSNCPVSHDEVVQRFGKPSGTIICGVNPYVDLEKKTCLFCRKVFGELDFSSAGPNMYGRFANE